MYKLRKSTKKVSRNFDPIFDVFLLYNGAPEIYEDPADYINLRVLKGGRIGGSAV